MPTYFFDVDDGELFLRDDFGVDLETLGEAAAQAAALLPDMARDTLLDMTPRDFVVNVRDEAGRVVHRAALLFRAQWGPEAGSPHLGGGSLVQPPSRVERLASAAGRMEVGEEPRRHCIGF